MSNNCNGLLSVFEELFFLSLTGEYTRRRIEYWSVLIKINYQSYWRVCPNLTNGVPWRIKTFLEKKQGVGTDRDLHKILPKRNTIIRSLGMYLNTKKIDNEGPRYWKYFLPTWSTPGMDTKYWHLSIITDSVGYRTISNTRWKDSQYPWYSMKLFSPLSFFLASYFYHLFFFFLYDFMWMKGDVGNMSIKQ